MNVFKIPFNKPGLFGNEIQYVAEAMRSGHISGDGPFTKRCRDLLGAQLGAARILLTTSCTHALEMSALLLNIQPGDEVIVPSFTFVSTVNAFVLRGAVPVFIDIRRDTLNMDETLLEALISPRTKAILPVHYAGVGCAMSGITEVARQHRIPIVEDNAHGLFATYRGRPLGSFGQLSTLSFHETKNFTCGEGGALVVNDDSLAERAEFIREHGTNRNRFFRGQVDKYTWVDIGSSYALSDVLAAFLLGQLEQREAIQAGRQRLWSRYQSSLSQWAGANHVQLPCIPAECQQAYHTFYMLMPSPTARPALISHLKTRGIASVFHYLPLHLSEMGKRWRGRPGQCPVTEDVSDRLLRLPLYNGLSEAEQTEVIEAIQSFETSW